MSSQAFSMNKALDAWLTSAAFGGVVFVSAFVGGNIGSMVQKGHGLNLRTAVLFSLFVVLAVNIVRFITWWIGRRRLLAEASLPDPGPIEMVKAWRLEISHIRTVRNQWDLFCRAHKLVSQGKVPGHKPVPKLNKITASVDGDIHATIYPGPLNVPKGVNAFRAVKEDACQAFGLYHFGVTETSIGHARLDFLWTDEFSRNLPIQKLPTASDGRIAYGIHRNGTVASLDPNKSTLVFGVQGSGKSSMVWTILAHWLRSGEWVDLYVVDPKGGQEWGWLLRMATITNCRVKVREFVKDDASAAKMLDKVAGIVKDRQARHGEVDLDDWSKDPMRQHVPTEAEPRIWIIMDELLHVRGSLKDTPTKPSPVGKIISIGRSECATITAVTQEATKETVGMVRDLFGQRVCLRSPSAAATAMVLADGAEASGATCSLIPESKPGLGYAYDDDHHGFAEVRVAHVTDHDIRADIQYGRPPAGMLNSSGVEEVCFNYRLYTTDMQPLRTGITNSFKDRYNQYRSDYEREQVAIEAGLLDPAKAGYWWWPYHDPSKTWIGEAPSRAVALERESEFIAQGVWRGNHQQNMKAAVRNVRPIEPEPQPTPRKIRRQPKPAENVVPIRPARTRGRAPERRTKPVPTRTRRSA